MEVGTTYSNQICGFKMTTQQIKYLSSVACYQTNQLYCETLLFANLWHNLRLIKSCT